MKPKILLPLALLATIAVASIFFFNKTTVLSSSAFIQDTLEKEKILNEERPEDRIYAQLDKPFYAPGENIWFTAYIRNGLNFAPSQKTDIIHAELIAPNGNVEQQYKLIAKDGVAKGDFSLAKNAVGGQYKVKVYSQWQKNDPNPAIFTKEIQVQKIVLPKLKMNLDFVRQGYGAGDLVDALVRFETNENEAFKNKSFSYVVSFGGVKGKTYTDKTNSDGKAAIQFKLPETLGTNDALINIMTDFQGSTESIAHTIPINLKNIDVAFFPEGGDLIATLPSQIAFKASDNAGKPVDVQGYVRNNNGDVVASLDSYHKGVGMFELTPESGERYTFEVTHPSGINKKYELPQIRSNGYVLSVVDVDKKTIKLNIHSSSSDEVSIIAGVRGKSHFTKTLQVDKGSNSLEIPVEDFPMGIAQITLFDNNGVARAERLTFVKSDKELKVKIKTDKATYLPREKVEVSLDVRDGNGQPMATNLSLAVVDDQLLSYADDKSSNMLSWMLLEADINEKIDEPAFYFDQSEAKAETALDLLLMTAGWRRFKWEAIAENQLPTLEHKAEKKVIAGTVLNAEGKPLSGAKIVIKNQTKPMLTNANGQFVIDKNIELFDGPASIILSAPDHKRLEKQLNEYGDIQYQLVGQDGFIAAVDVPQIARPRTATEQVSVSNRASFQVRARNIRWTRPNRIASTSDFQTVEESLPKNEDAVVTDRRVTGRTNADSANEANQGRPSGAMVYYRAREFAAPKYAKKQTLKKRTDFRSTVFWNGNIEVDESGKATLSFYNSDAVTSFNITAEGMTKDGLIGQNEFRYYTQMPFSLSAKIPVEVVAGDLIEIPVTIANNTEFTVSGKLDLSIPWMLEAIDAKDQVVTMAAHSSQTIKLKYKVTAVAKEGQDDLFKINFNSAAFEDEIEEAMVIVPKGFPVRTAYSGTDKETTYEIDISEPIDKSVDVVLEAYPSTLAEVLQGIEGMMQQPTGCFEQTSSKNYPNLIAMQYMQETGLDNIEVRQKAEKYFAMGYKNLKKFQATDGSFDWFNHRNGQGEGNESLTAFSLMQFTHFKQVYPEVEQSIIDKSAAWLLNRRDGNGGFLTSPKTAYSIGNLNKNALDAYIVYALSEAKIEGIEKELNAAYNKALKASSKHQKALVANALYNYGENTRAAEVLASMENATSPEQADNRTTYGTKGKYYTVETEALELLALLKTETPDIMRSRNLAKSIRSQRQGLGRFGSTQTTVTALRALTAQSKFNKQTAEDGTVEVYIDGEKVASHDYKKGEHETIVLDDLGKNLKNGKHSIAVKYPGAKYPLPHTISVNWRTVTPQTSPNCVLALNTHLEDTNIKVGETVRLSATLANKTDKVQATPMAIIGLPAGLSPSAKQLNEMVKNETIAYYEIVGNNIVFYYRHIDAAAQKNINLDLKADFAGTFDAPASSAYLYYDDVHRSWAATENIVVQ